MQHLHRPVNLNRLFDVAAQFRSSEERNRGNDIYGCGCGCGCGGGDANAFDARKPVMQALIEHLHGFVVTENTVSNPGVA